MGDNAGKIGSAIAGTILVLGFIFGFVKYDDRLAKCEDVKKEFAYVEKKIGDVEVQTVQTFEQFRKEQDARHYDYIEDQYTMEYYRCRGLQRSYPNDTALAQDCDEILEEQKRLKEKKMEMHSQ